MHEEPHFKSNGACDCMFECCLKLIFTKPGQIIGDYVCICPDCNGECDSPHELR